jgi:hypothetical protein
MFKARLVVSATRLILIVVALALVFGWAALGRGQAAAPQLAAKSYLPVIANPAKATATPTATATMPATASATATSESTATATATAIPTRNPDVCAAEYPTVCIPPPPPDLNCSDIPYRRFTVLPPDRHQFDRDHNGIGCESG